MAKYSKFLPVDITVKDILNNTGKQINIWGLTSNEMADILGRLRTGNARFAKPKPEKHIRNVWATDKVLTITINNDDLGSVIDRLEEKREKRGGFSKKLFLEKVLKK